MEYRTTALALQGGDLRCGFWAVFFGWALLLRISPTHKAVPRLTGDDVALKLATLYKAFLENEQGLPTATLNDVFHEFEFDPNLLKDVGDVVRTPGLWHLRALCTNISFTLRLLSDHTVRNAHHGSISTASGIA